LKGKIALAKYGGPFRGLKVKNAQLHGMIGCIIFTDPGSDGDMTEAKGYLAYPGKTSLNHSIAINRLHRKDGPARNPSSVQRGVVVDMTQYSGGN
jgi:N-acetylated-alpha-linked acidic dipeptidase